MRLIDADALIEKIKAKATEMFTVDSVYEYYIDALIDVEDIIKAQPTADVVERKKGEWIPCSERLPEKECFALVTVNDGAIYTDLSLFRYDGRFIEHTGDIIAWMPLPEPYEEEKNE